MPEGSGWLVALSILGAVGAAFLGFRFARWCAGWSRWWIATQERRLLGLGLFAGLVGGVTLVRGGAVGLTIEAAWLAPGREAETSYVPPHDVLRAASLGHQGFAADMLFIRANQYFVRHLFTDRTFAWLDTFVAGILALDPMHQRVYEWATRSVKYSQLLDNATLERSNRYALAGIERFPDHWRFYFDVGFNDYFEWHAQDGAERDRMRKKALPYFALAAALPGSKLDPNFLTELYRMQDDAEMALFQAYLHYWDAGDRERQALVARIQTLGASAQAQRLGRLEAAWKAELAYLPLGLYELVGGDPRGKDGRQ